MTATNCTGTDLARAGGREENWARWPASCLSVLVCKTQGAHRIHPPHCELCGLSDLVLPCEQEQLPPRIPRVT